LNPNRIKRFFYSPKCPDWLCVPHSLLFNRYRASLLGEGIKPPGHKVNHSPWSSVAFKNEWCYTSTPPISLHSMDREKCTFSKILQCGYSYILKWGSKLL
jgi:hypothetical protein